MSGTALNLPQSQIDTLLARFPTILTDAERLLPEPQRNAKAIARITHMIKTSENKKAQQEGQARALNGGGGGPSQVRPPAQNGNGQAAGQNMMNNAQQAQMNQVGQAGQVGQSPKMVMYSGGMAIPQQGQPIPPQGQQMSANQQQAYQEQMRLQQQHQQQTHIADGMHKNQRVQQHPAQQGQLAHQQNNIMPHQASGSNMTIPSPQQHHPVLGSPHANAQNNGRSPSQVPPRQAPTPVPDNMGTQNNVKTLMDSFPKLLELKRQGLLLPDQEKHLNSLMASEAGRAHLNQVRAQQANSLIQNVLSNPVGQHQPQIPPQLQQQLNHQQQQQLAAQMAQQQHQQMGLQGFPQAMMHNQQHQPQTQEQQLAQQQLQQMQMRQLQQQQQQQQQGIRPPTAAQAQVMARVQAQQAQNQIMQAAQQMGHVPQQNQLQQHMIDQQNGANFGSPRPPQQVQQRTQGLGPERAMQIKNTLIRLTSMNDAQREAQFQQNPADRNVWIAAHKSNQANQLNQLNLANQQNLQAQMMQNAQGNSPAAGMQARPQAGNNANGGGGFALANNMPNLHIPASKQRNSLSQGQQPGGSPAAGTPPMRPPMPLANPTQQAQIQRMLNQGIPVNMPGGVRPPMANGQAQQQGTAGQKIEPFMIVNQINKQQFPQQHQQQLLQQQQQQQPAGDATGPIRRMSEQPPLPLDRSGSLLSRVTWTPSAEYDSALREKLSDFRRPIKPSGRPTLSHGFGVSRVIGDVILERMPEGLSAIAEDADGVLTGDKKKNEEGSGMPGQKKRKVAELAETVDRHLEVDRDVETCILQLADEHVELMANLGCMLAKHRKSDTVDRKDLQLAYEMMEGRNIPGFSSDSIRLDQARSTRRAAAPLGQARLNKLKSVQDAKVMWRREKAAKLEEQRQIMEDGDGDDDEMGDMPVPETSGASAPEVLEIDFAVDSTPKISIPHTSATGGAFEVPAKIGMSLESAPMGIVA